MEMAGKHSDHYFCRRQAKIVTTINFCCSKNWRKKYEKCFKLPDLARKLIRTPHPGIFSFSKKVDQKNFLKI
jgi:hypothetical protein